VFVFAYLVVGSLLRLAHLGDVGASARLSGMVAIAGGGLILARWRTICDWLSRQRVSAGAALALTAIACAGDLIQYWQWARNRTTLNYQASAALGAYLPPGTLVHGKLANGLSLQNSIRPVFVGRGFGNYEDRTARDDVRYVLTLISPSLGYESQKDNPVIKDVLDAYPRHTTVTTFAVAETGTGHDRAALIDKFGLPGRGGATEGRAHH
jgi:hypothetical protein